jgi:hypothetical protein
MASFGVAHSLSCYPARAEHSHTSRRLMKVNIIRCVIRPGAVRPYTSTVITITAKKYLFFCGE